MNNIEPGDRLFILNLVWCFTHQFYQCTSQHVGTGSKDIHSTCRIHNVFQQNRAGSHKYGHSHRVYIIPGFYTADYHRSYYRTGKGLLNSPVKLN